MYNESFSVNPLVSWVLGQCDQWRVNRDTNYLDTWKEYERLWRGIYDSSDRTRDSERSRIITPALQQAIEAHTAEIEEAVFGRGEKFFDISDDRLDNQKLDIEAIRNQMTEDFKKGYIRKSVSDIILLSALYGTGIGEITVYEKKELKPAMQPIIESGNTAVGVIEQERFCVGLKPITPYNFLIDPTASNVQEALGCAIEEFVSLHSVTKAMEDGVYNTITDLSSTSVDSDLEVSQEVSDYGGNRVKLLRYYGLIPKYMLDNQDDEDKYQELFNKKSDEYGSEAADYTDLVEAIVVIANDGHLLKAEESPYMMNDRPIVAFQSDTIPNRFWGRGIAEKGFNMQKAIDAQIRAHLDSVALSTVPMMAIDATRLPRGAKFEVKAGKTILTNGNPAEILQPFKFGNTDPSNINTASSFMNMLLMATSTVDSASLPAMTTGEGQGMSVALSSIIKKNKRTLVNFQEQFLIPFVTKAAHRFMQFDPERYPAQDFVFIPSSNLGIIAREHEQMQFLNLLKTLGAESPIVPLILSAVIENSGLSNRETLIAQLQQMMQPDPQQAQAQQAAMQMQMQKTQLELADLQADIQLKQAKTQSEAVETQLKPTEMQAKVAASASKYLGEADDPTKEFEKRIKLANVALKEKDIDTKARIAELQLQSSRNT
tara:strand:- start:7089 stop:9062 length:1974 start_codon:yes stop_codon:yes gene_type:complete